MASLFQQLNLFISLGFIVQIVGRFAGRGMGGEAGALIGLAISLVGLVIFIWGCMQMAMRRAIPSGSACSGSSVASAS